MPDVNYENVKKEKEVKVNKEQVASIAPTKIPDGPTIVKIPERLPKKSEMDEIGDKYVDVNERFDDFDLMKPEEIENNETKTSLEVDFDDDEDDFGDFHAFTASIPNHQSETMQSTNFATNCDEDVRDDTQCQDVFASNDLTMEFSPSIGLDDVGNEGPKTEEIIEHKDIEQKAKEKEQVVSNDDAMIIQQNNIIVADDDDDDDSFGDFHDSSIALEVSEFPAMEVNSLTSDMVSSSVENDAVSKLLGEDEENTPNVDFDLFASVEAISSDPIPSQVSDTEKSTKNEVCTFEPSLNEHDQLTEYHDHGNPKDDIDKVASAEVSLPLMSSTSDVFGSSANGHVVTLPQKLSSSNDNNDEKHINAASIDTDDDFGDFHESSNALAIDSNSSLNDIAKEGKPTYDSQFLGKAEISTTDSEVLTSMQHSLPMPSSSNDFNTDILPGSVETVSVLSNQVVALCDRIPSKSDDDIDIQKDVVDSFASINAPIVMFGSPLATIEGLENPIMDLTNPIITEEQLPTKDNESIISKEDLDDFASAVESSMPVTGSVATTCAEFETSTDNNEKHTMDLEEALANAASIDIEDDFGDFHYSSNAIEIPEASTVIGKDSSMPYHNASLDIVQTERNHDLDAFGSIQSPSQEAGNSRDTNTGGIFGSVVVDNSAASFTAPSLAEQLTSSSIDEKKSPNDYVDVFASLDHTQSSLSSNNNMARCNYELRTVTAPASGDVAMDSTNLVTEQLPPANNDDSDQCKPKENFDVFATLDPPIPITSNMNSGNMLGLIATASALNNPDNATIITQTISNQVMNLNAEAIADDIDDDFGDFHESSSNVITQMNTSVDLSLNATSFGKNSLDCYQASTDNDRLKIPNQNVDMFASMQQPVSTTSKGHDTNTENDMNGSMATTTPAVMMNVDNLLSDAMPFGIEPKRNTVINHVNDDDEDEFGDFHCIFSDISALSKSQPPIDSFTSNQQAFVTTSSSENNGEVQNSSISTLSTSLKQNVQSYDYTINNNPMASSTSYMNGALNTNAQNNNDFSGVSQATSAMSNLAANEPKHMNNINVNNNSSNPTGNTITDAFSIFD